MINLDLKEKEFFITDCIKNEKAYVYVDDEKGDKKKQYLRIKNDFLSLRLEDKDGIDSNSL